MTGTALPPAVVPQVTTDAGRARLTAVDAFRGATMAAMVVVNHPGDWNHVYPPLLHAAWHGWTPTDLIFPFFVFLLGVSVTLSRTRRRSLTAILQRSAVLYLLGLLLALYPRFDITTVRLMGVLPRLALCYLAAALVYRRLTGLPQRQRAVAALVIAGACLLGYWALLMLVAPPGGVAGDLSPSGNLGAWLDRTLLGEAHLWRSSRTWDPEGLLSTMPAVGTAMLGVTAGVVLDAPRPSPSRAAVLVAAGALMMALGLLWDAAFPMNKNLWTSSYAAFTGGLAALLLGLAYAACDVAGHRRGTHPLVVLGVNALTLFVVSGWLVKTLLLVRVPSPDGTGQTAYAWLYETFFAPWGTPENTSLAFALAMLVMLYVLCAWLYRRGLWLRA